MPTAIAIKPCRGQALTHSKSSKIFRTASRGCVDWSRTSNLQRTRSHIPHRCQFFNETGFARFRQTPRWVGLGACGADRIARHARGRGAVWRASSCFPTEIRKAQLLMSIVTQSGDEQSLRRQEFSFELVEDYAMRILFKNEKRDRTATTFEDGKSDFAAISLSYSATKPRRPPTAEEPLVLECYRRPADDFRVSQSSLVPSPRQYH